MDLVKEIKKYFLYLNELGFNYIPANKNFKKLLQNNTYLSENTLEKLKNTLVNCEKCPLHRVRKQPIWGEGNLEAKLMLISEFPDKDEDFYGKPFVGIMEELLEKILKSINLTRKDFFITHAVKCKTPGGRPPESEEILACKTYLLKQVKLIKPKLILALGFTPPKIFFNNTPTFSSVRGQPIKLKDFIILFTYHPSYILKNPAVKRLLWEDLQKFRKLYEEIFRIS
ncbi:MAG: uracil-DNA glycosylase [Thermodesulfobacterium geofontis]|uniref:Type-4 uracil-DNA glycosylase n=1 Tax=Thermodesulfobacterium geofontis TaxID=1295609 RepID=A0A2N7QFP8_9BACT|nr:MAG: uracil-DNA glycosylase [Thermodesulfobacterium geofontis]